MANLNELSTEHPTAVILSTTQEKHWSEGTDQTITRTLLGNRYAVDFSSVNSHTNYPFLNETCAFITDTETGEEGSEVVGSANMSVHEFLSDAGYEVIYGLDNLDQKELG